MAASKQTATALILCGLLAGCGSGDRTLTEVDPNAVPLDARVRALLPSAKKGADADLFIQLHLWN